MSTPGISAAERAALLGADRTTGELRATSLPVKAKLTQRGLAAPHAHSHRHYLTAAGRDLLSHLTAPATITRPVSDPPDGGSARLFAPAYGDESEVPAGHARDVAAAWAALREIRRLAGDLLHPAPVERTSPRRYVALALEASGIPASSVDAAGHRTRTGYRAQDGDEPGTVRIEWRGPASSDARQSARTELERCAAQLARVGWQSLLYSGRGNALFLLVSPNRL